MTRAPLPEKLPEWPTMESTEGPLLHRDEWDEATRGLTEFLKEIG